MGLIEVISESTGKISTLQYMWSTPIHCMIMSFSLMIQKAGCLPLGTFLTDHRLLWLDLNQSSGFGFTIPWTIKISMRHFNAKFIISGTNWCHYSYIFWRNEKSLKDNFHLKVECELQHRSRNVKLFFSWEQKG